MAVEEVIEEIIQQVEREEQDAWDKVMDIPNGMDNR